VRNLLICALVGLIALFSDFANRQIATYRISCGSFEGVRAQFATNPISQPDEKNRLIKKEDAISGLRLELTFSTGHSQATVTTFGNENTSGAVQSFSVNRIECGEVISFVGVDPRDGSTNLLSIFSQEPPSMDGSYEQNLRRRSNRTRKNVRRDLQPSQIVSFGHGLRGDAMKVQPHIALLALLIAIWPHSLAAQGVTVLMFGAGRNSCAHWGSSDCAGSNGQRRNDQRSRNAARQA
jgi:hypothetical protein